MAKILREDDHDTVVRKYAELVEKNNPDQYVVKTNIGGDRGNLIGEITPDIVLYNLSGEKIITAIEIETNESLSSKTAAMRWKPIIDRVPSLQILVPKGTAAKTKRICKKFGIKAKIQEFG